MYAEDVDAREIEHSRRSWASETGIDSNRQMEKHTAAD